MALSDKWIANSRFCALSHGYYYEKDSGASILKSILNDGELIIGDREDQYPGVYMNFETIGKTLEPYTDVVILVFSKALLKSPAWHTSDTGYGVIDDTSYCPETFQQCKTTPIEIVFHHNISLEYLEFIVAPERFYDEVLEIVGEKWPIHVGRYKLERSYTKLLSEPSMYADVPFSLGYLVDNPDAIYTPHVLKCTMLNMGYPLNVIQMMFLLKDENSIIKAIQLESKDRIDYPVVVYCPY